MWSNMNIKYSLTFDKHMSVMMMMLMKIWRQEISFMKISKGNWFVKFEFTSQCYNNNWAHFLCILIIYVNFPTLFSSKNKFIVYPRGVKKFIAKTFPLVIKKKANKNGKIKIYFFSAPLLNVTLPKRQVKK